MMIWALQLAELASLAAIAVSTHVLVARARQPFIEGLEGLAGRVVGALAAISDVVSGLLYIGFALAVMPFDPRPVGRYQLESVLDTIAVFAVLVAAIQVISLVALHRIAHHLEPWPPASMDVSSTAEVRTQ